MKNKKKILLIRNSSESFLSFHKELIEKLVSNNYRVFIVAPEYNVIQFDKIKKLKANPILLKFKVENLNPFVFFIETIKLFQKLFEIKPEIIIAFTPKCIIQSLFVSTLLGVPKKVAVITGLGYLFTEENDRLRLIYKKVMIWIIIYFYKLLLNKCQKIFFLNKDDVELFIEKKVLKKSNYSIIEGEGIDLSYWKYIPPVLFPVTFIMVSRLIKEKGVIEYLIAAKKIKEKYKNTRFILLGDFYGS